MVAFRSNAPRADLCCSGENILSCSRINVSPKLVTSQMNINILGTEFYFANRVEPHGYAYKNRWLDEAVLTYNNKTDTMFGSVHIQGKEYEIEKCRDGHVMKQRKKYVITKDDVLKPVYKIPRNPALGFWGARDQTTIVTFTIKFYYNEEFARVTHDVEGWIDNSVAMVNQAMINSLVPVRVKKFATEMTMMIPEFFPVEEGRGTDGITAELPRLSNDVLNSADFATVLTTGAVGFGAHGAAFLGGQYSANPKDATAVRHEFGHTFGVNHYNHDAKNGYAFGHFEENKFGTIVGGNSINYYSNPRINHPKWGPIGRENINDAARYITEQRFFFSNRGDESRTCYTCNAYSGQRYMY